MCFSPSLTILPVVQTPSSLTPGSVTGPAFVSFTESPVGFGECSGPFDWVCFLTQTWNLPSLQIVLGPFEWQTVFKDGNLDAGVSDSPGLSLGLGLRGKTYIIFWMKKNKSWIPNTDILVQILLDFCICTSSLLKIMVPKILYIYTIYTYTVYYIYTHTYIFYI